MNLEKLEDQLSLSLQNETSESLKIWITNKRKILDFVPENNSEQIVNAWESEWKRLNWGTPVTQYVAEAQRNHELHHGQFYWIVLRDTTVGFFTVYNFRDLPPGLGMFCLFPGLGFGSKNYILKKLKKFKTFWGFCNSAYLHKLYTKLGFSSTRLGVSLWLIGDPTIWHTIESKQFALDEIF